MRMACSPRRRRWAYRKARERPELFAVQAWRLPKAKPGSLTGVRRGRAEMPMMVGDYPLREDRRQRCPCSPDAHGV
jgi:hypothetical protein